MANNLGVSSPTVGGDFDTWGDDYLADHAILNKFAGDTHTVSATSGDVTLTVEQCQNFSIKATGSGGTTVNIRVPDSISRYWYVDNARATGSITIRCVAGGDVVTLAAGEKALVRSDGTNCGNLSLATLAIAAVSGLQAALDAKAALNSPVFTGNPTAPTPSPGDNDTSIATTGFVKAAIDVVLGGVSSAFDTLSEIATAIGGLMVKSANLSDVANPGTARSNLGLVIGTDVQAHDANTAKLDVEDQTLAGGARVTVKSLGNLSGNSITPDPGDRPIQKITNNGAGSILPGSNEGTYVLEVLNTTGAGVITTTGWTVEGDSFDTTTTSKFLCSCIVTSDMKVLAVRKVA